MARKKRQQKRERGTESEALAPASSVAEEFDDELEADLVEDGPETEEAARPSREPVSTSTRSGGSWAPRMAPSKSTEARDERRRRAQARKSRRRLFYGLGGGAIAAALIAGLVLPSLGNIGGFGGGNTAGDDGTAVSSQGTLPSVGTEIAVLPGAGSPPTTGTSEAALAAWGVHDSRVADEAVVRNLERGAVVLNYNLADEFAVQDLVAFAESQQGFPGCFVMHPYEGVTEGTVTLTSWGWLQNYPGTDKAGMQGFIQDHRNGGAQYIDATCGSGVALSAPPPVAHDG